MMRRDRFQPTWAALWAQCSVAVLLLFAAACQAASPPTPAAPKPGPADRPVPPTTVPAAVPTGAKPTAQPTVAPAAPAAALPVAKPIGSTATDSALDGALLYERARAEGRVVVYSSLNLDDGKNVFPLFEARFPGITVEHARASGTNLTQRLVTEARGGRQLADVFNAPAFDTRAVEKEGLLAAYRPPAAAAIPESLRDPQGRWYAIHLIAGVVAWNTDLLEAGEAPRSFLDVADPRWQDRLMMDPDDVDFFMGVVKQRFPTEQEGLDFFRRVAANNPQFFSGHPKGADLLAAGERPLYLFMFANNIAALQRKGGPVAWLKTEATITPSLVGVLERAPHPNAARLFTDWLLGPEAQQALADVGRLPTRPGMRQGVELLAPDARLYVTQPAYADEVSRYAELWQQIFRLR